MTKTFQLTNSPLASAAFIHRSTANNCRIVRTLNVKARTCRARGICTIYLGVRYSNRDYFLLTLNRHWGIFLCMVNRHGISGPGRRYIGIRMFSSKVSYRFRGLAIGDIGYNNISIGSPMDSHSVATIADPIANV